MIFITFKPDKTSFDDFHKNVKFYDNYFIDFFNYFCTVKIGSFKEISIEINEIAKYFGFVSCVFDLLFEVFDIERIDDTDKIKFINIININVTTMCLIKDALILILNKSLFGVNGIARMILENYIISNVLSKADVVTNKIYYDWQYYDLKESMDRLNVIPEIRSRKKFSFAYDNVVNRYNELQERYNIHKSDSYGWAKLLSGKKSHEKVGIKDLMEYVWGKTDHTDLISAYMVEFNKYIHTTPYIVHSKSINEILEGDKSIYYIYAKIIVLISMELDNIFYGINNIFSTFKLCSNTKELEKINNYYAMGIEKYKQPV